MTLENIKEYCKRIVEILGKKIKANKKTTIEVADDKGNTVSKPSEEAAVLERTYSGYGLDISFYEETDDYLAVFFNDELVFNTVGDNYDADKYDKLSSVLMKLKNDDDTFASECFVNGEWENLLKRISDNAETIKEKMKQAATITKLIQEDIAARNSLMARYMPFRHPNEQHFYIDNEVYVDLIGESCRVFKVKMVRKFLRNEPHFSAEDCVFDASTGLFIPGDWEKHIEEILSKEWKRLKIKPEDLRKKLEPETETVSSEPIKSVDDYMAELDKII